MTRPAAGFQSGHGSAKLLPEARPHFIQLLLVCGMLSSVLYATMLVIVPSQWASYRSASWTVSELSAIGAPTRSLWVSLATVWTLLYVAFGGGTWLSAGGSRALRVTGGLIMAAGIFGFFWPPMHQREALAAGGRTLTDTLHIVWTVINGVLTLSAMGCGASAFGKQFRRFSFAIMALVVAAGIMTSRDAPGVDANLPTPFIGVWERINIGAWLLWVMLLAVALMRRAQPKLPVNSAIFDALRDDSRAGPRWLASLSTSCSAVRAVSRAGTRLGL